MLVVLSSGCSFPPWQNLDKLARASQEEKDCIHSGTNRIGSGILMKLSRRDFLAFVP
jgi:hypothetical protein